MTFFTSSRSRVSYSNRAFASCTKESVRDDRNDQIAAACLVQFVFLLSEYLASPLLTFQNEPLDFRLYDLAHLRADSVVVVLMIYWSYLV